MPVENHARLAAAVRVYPALAEAKAKRPRKPWHLPEATLVFDTETRTDATQALTFGSYRFLVSGECREEGLFYGDDLSKSEREALEHYAATHRAETSPGNESRLHLISRTEFLDKLYRSIYKGRHLLVGFNLPFDLSRVACDFSPARGRFAGGFSLALWSYKKDGQERLNSYRPRVCIKHIDSKRALKGFSSRNSPDQNDLIPEGSENGDAEPGYKFRGHFLDLRTLAFSLTDSGHSLESACQTFGVEHGKEHVARHGEITEEYVTYNRHDVRATVELAEKLLAEYAKHPIDLQVTKAYSPASIGKAYLRKMKIEPIIERQRIFRANISGTPRAHSLEDGPAPISEK